MALSVVLTQNIVRDFFDAKDTKAYDIFNKIKKSVEWKGPEYVATLFDLCDYTGWSPELVMFAVYVTKKDAVEFFGNAIVNKNKTIAINSKYGGKAVLSVPSEQEMENEIEHLHITDNGITKKAKKKAFKKF